MDGHARPLAPRSSRLPAPSRRRCATRVRLIAAAPNTFSLDHLAVPRQPLRRRRPPAAPDDPRAARSPALAHAFVFWGFVAFGGYTTVEFLHGLGIVDLTHTRLVRRVPPRADAVRGGRARRHRLSARSGARSCGRSALGDEGVGRVDRHRAVHRGADGHVPAHVPAGRGARLAGRINWWAHMLVILAFLALIPASKHFHLVLSPITVFLKSPELGNLPNLDFEKEQVGLETVKDLGSKMVLDAFTCVECGRCQVNCPAWGAGKELNPKTIILQTQERAARRRARQEARRGLFREGAVAVHDLRRLREPVPGRHRAPADSDRLAARPGVQRRRAGVSRRDVQPPRAPQQHLGPRLRPAHRSSSTSAELETFDPAKHDVLVWLGCAGSFEADFQKSLRSLFEILRARGVKFGVLSKEKCTGDPAKRTGNEYMFQELATANIEELKAAGPKKILTSCPHCVKTIGDDYRRFGYEVEIVHSSVFVEELLRDATSNRDGDRSDDATVTFHDPCYLGRYGGKVDEPRALLTRFGARHQRARAQPREPVLLRRRRRAAVRRQGRGAGHAHQRRPVQAAPGHRRRHGRHRVSVLLDHAEGRAGQRRRERRRDAVRRPDDLCERQIAKRRRRRGRARV